MMSHAKFICPYKTREWNQIPDLFYRYTEQSIKVYNSLQNNDLTNSISTDRLKEMTNENTLIIRYVLDAAYKRKPILIIIASTEETEDIVGSNIILFWYDIFSDNIRQIKLDKPLSGTISVAAMTRLPLTLMEKNYRELVNEKHLRHLLVFGKENDSVLAVLLHDNETENCVYGKSAEVSLPPNAPGAITALYILPQNLYDKRKGFNDPRILVGTSKGSLQVLRFKALLKLDITIVPSQNFAEFIDYDNEPINYITYVRAPHQKKMFVVVGQNTPKSINPSQYEKDNVVHNEKAYISVIEISGNHRRKLAAQLSPEILKSYIISTTRIIPYDDYYQVTAVFQSTLDKQHFEVDVWTVKDNKVILDVAKEAIETDMQHSIQDIWPLKGKSGYMLLYPEKAINPEEEIGHDAILPFMDYDNHNFDDGQSVVTETTDRYDTSEPPSTDYYDDVTYQNEEGSNYLEVENTAYEHIGTYIDSEGRQVEYNGTQIQPTTTTINDHPVGDSEYANGQIENDENILLNEQNDSSSVILDENNNKKDTEDDHNEKLTQDNDSHVNNREIIINNDNQSSITDDEQETQTPQLKNNIDDEQEMESSQSNSNMGCEKNSTTSTTFKEDAIMEDATEKSAQDLNNDEDDEDDNDNRESSYIKHSSENQDILTSPSTQILDDDTRDECISKEHLIIENKFKKNTTTTANEITIDEQNAITSTISSKESEKKVHTEKEEAIQTLDDDHDTNKIGNKFINEENSLVVTTEKEYQSPLTNTNINSDQLSDASVISNNENDPESMIDEIEDIEYNMDNVLDYDLEYAVDGNMEDTVDDNMEDSVDDNMEDAVDDNMEDAVNDNTEELIQQDESDYGSINNEPTIEFIDKNEIQHLPTDLNVNNNDEQIKQSADITKPSINEYATPSQLNVELSSNLSTDENIQRVLSDEQSTFIVKSFTPINNECSNKSQSSESTDIDDQSSNNIESLKNNEQIITLSSSTLVNFATSDNHEVVNEEKNIDQDEIIPAVNNTSTNNDNIYHNQLYARDIECNNVENENIQPYVHSSTNNTTPKSLTKSNHEELSISECLKIARSADNDDTQHDLYSDLFDLIFVPTPLDIDKSLKAIEELQLSKNEEYRLMKYCYKNEQSLLKLFIMHYNISKKNYNLVLMQRNSMNQQSSSIPSNILITCNNLSRLAEKLVAPVLLDLPIDILGGDNPFTEMSKSSLKRKRGLNFGAELVNQVVKSRKRRIVY